MGCTRKVLPKNPRIIHFLFWFAWAPACARSRSRRATARLAESSTPIIASWLALTGPNETTSEISSEVK